MAGVEAADGRDRVIRTVAKINGGKPFAILETTLTETANGTVQNRITHWAVSEWG
jgi:hypothetical protein